MRVEEPPGVQTTVGDADILTVGVGNTCIVEVPVPQIAAWQPLRDTVYVPGAVKEMLVVPLFTGEKTTLGDEADQVKEVSAVVEV